MDSEVLANIPDCKKCEWWRERVCKCRLPDGLNCPQGNQRPQQETALPQERILE